MISLSEPGNSGEYRGEPGNLWHPGIWTTPTANLPDALRSKNSFCKRRRQYEEKERGWMQTMSGHVGKISLFSQLLPKNVTGDIKRQKIRNLHYHPKTTWPFPAPRGQENWTGSLTSKGLWSFGTLYCQGGRLQPPAPRTRMRPRQNPSSC